MNRVYAVLVAKSERKRPLRRHGHNVEYNVRINDKEVKWEVLDWTYLGQDRSQ
jgi:hypothetical protein